MKGEDWGQELVPLEVVRPGRPAAAAPPRPAPRRLPGWLVPAGALALVVALVAGHQALDRGRPPERAGEVAAPVVPDLVAAAEPAPPGWRRLALGPLAPRAGEVAVWTGRRLVVAGGHPDSRGATWRPDSGRWQPIARSLLAERSGAVAAWTGREMLIWGGRDGHGRLASGGAYDPLADRWRLLTPGPLDPVVPLAGVWTGHELVVVGGARSPFGWPSTQAAAYDPHHDTWRSLPDMPVLLDRATGAWTGREVVVFGTLRRGERERIPAAVAGAAWHPDHGWRTLPRPPLSGRSATAAWAGDHLVAWDSSLRAAAWDPATDTWSPLPKVPLARSDCPTEGTGAGTLVFVASCGQGALYRSSTRTWEAVTHPARLWGKPIWAGDRLLFWVAHRFGRYEPGMWSYRPPSGEQLAAP